MTAGRIARPFALALVWVMAVAVLSMAPGLAVPPVGAATGPATFGTPSSDSSFEDGIDFRQPVTINRPLVRVELLLTFGDALGQTVIPVTVPTGTGSSTLTYHLDQDVEGHLYPGTHLVASWRLASGDDAADVVVGPDLELQFVDDRFDWQSAAGDLIRVHWYEGPASFGQRALRIGEDAVGQAATLLGVSESEPIDFYVYADQDAFYDALGPGTRENVGGAQIPGTRFMFALIPPDEIDDSWVGVVVPHELTHLVFETAAQNPYHFPPRWLNEGLATYLSQGYDTSDRRIVERAAGDSALIPLDGLIGQFPTSFDQFSLAYAESVAAVDYLIRTHGQEPLVTLIRSYAEGRTDDEAFEAALGLDVAGFGAAWLDDLGAAAPTRFGPQPAPPGPIPSAWLGSAAASAPPADSGVATSGPDAVPPSSGVAADGSVPIVLVVLVGVIALVVIVLAARSRRVLGGPSG